MRCRRKVREGKNMDKTDVFDHFIGSITKPYWHKKCELLKHLRCYNIPKSNNRVTAVPIDLHYLISALWI